MSKRVYAGLLRVYPAAFRTRYRDEMLVLFGDRLRDAKAGRGVVGLAGTWASTLADLFTSAIGEHTRRDRAMAHSLATFEPTRSMRLLGLFGLVGAALLLWAFVSFNPFGDPALNRVRLVLFALAGAAISLAFYPRQAAAAPTLGLLTTGAVAIAGVWYVTWILLAPGVPSPFIGTFGLVNLFANVALWVTPTVWAIGMLHTGAAWRGMGRNLRLTTKLGLTLLLGSAIGWLGDDRLGLVDSLWGAMLSTIVLIGVAMNGFGWAILGAVLVAARGEPRAEGPGTAA